MRVGWEFDLFLEEVFVSDFQLFPKVDLDYLLR